MDMHTQFETGNMFFLLAFFPFLIWLLLFIFAVYFVIKVIKFMNEKTLLDRAKNEKLTELINAINEQKNSN